MRWYEQRDSDKIKNDKAMNDFEAMIYRLREWLREDDNEPFVEATERDTYIETLAGHEDWLYEDGANANYTVFDKMYKTLLTDYDKYEARKNEGNGRDEFIKDTLEALDKFDENVQDL